MSPTVRKLLPAVAGIVIVFGGAFVFLAYKYFSAKEIGEECQINECNGPAGEYCVFDDDGGFCAPQCEATSDCPDGWTCEQSTEIDQHGLQHEGVMFCMRPGPNALHSGSATVTRVEGNVPGVANGTACTYRHLPVVPQGDGLDSRWEVACGGHLRYGAEGGGYNPRADASWAPGVLVSDPSTTSQDGDPSIVFGAGTITIRDDASGPHGALTVTLAADH